MVRHTNSLSSREWPDQGSFFFFSFFFLACDGTSKLVLDKWKRKGKLFIDVIVVVVPETARPSMFIPVGCRRKLSVFLLLFMCHLSSLLNGRRADEQQSCRLVIDSHFEYQYCKLVYSRGLYYVPEVHVQYQRLLKHPCELRLHCIIINILY